MKLTFRQAEIVGAGIGNPKGDPVLSYTFAAPFTAALAKKLGCYELVYDGENPERPVLRHFKAITLKQDIESATAEFVRTADGTIHQLQCIAQVVDVRCEDDEESGPAAIVRVKLYFRGEAEKAPAFAALLETPAPEWSSVTIGGKQADLEFEETS